MFQALGRFAFARRWPVIGASVVALLVALAVLLRGGSLTSGDTQGTEADLGRKLVDAQLQLPGASSFVIVFAHETLEVEDEAYAAALRHALAPLRADPRVARVIAPDDLPSMVAARFRSEDAHRALAVVMVRGDYRTSARVYPELRRAVRPGPLHATFTGYLAYRSDLDETLAHDLVLAEALSLPLALFVLLYVFRTAVAAALPVFVGGLAVLGGMAAVMALSRVIDVAAYAINVTSLIGLGVAIDYSLFIVSRYRDELARGRSYEEALVIAVDTAGRAVAFSGIAVGIGLSGLVFLRGSFLAPMGIAGAVVVALAVVASLTFLPAILAALGPRIHAGRMPFVAAEARLGAGIFARVARHVMARPLVVLVPAVALLVTLALPFARLRLAVADVGILPREAEARRGFELLREHFPDHAATRVYAVARFPSSNAGAPPAGASVLTEERAGALYDRSRAIAAIPGVRAVESIVDLGDAFDRAGTAVVAATPAADLSPDLRFLHEATVGRDIAVLQVLVDGPSAGDGARAVVRGIRAMGGVADGRVIVTGQTADDLDVTAFILERAPKAIAFVVAMTLLVLFVLLRSVLLPLKAVAMNFLSIGASFGALVWIFQDGHLAGLLRFDPTATDPTLPVLLFCTIFGLSMDYEVLMLTRMHEEYVRTGDNTHAVAEGLEQTGALVTSAAAIMVAVFAAFALATVVAMKAMGVALAIAVALDATIVRVLVVPATMRLMGAWNWWAPGRRAR